ncbi:MAG TPA: ATP-binding protein [Nostocaceae cyanobacterium]|nr:ATP-binding protein [Nostocaceae cyanobacterium]
MSQNTPVPRLDLAPKLRRPLSLLNPLDYLRLLYWVFYFPQALRWYVDTFGGGYISPKEMKWQKLWELISQNSVKRKLLFQGLVLTVITPLIICLFFQIIGISINWSFLALGVVIGLVTGLVSTTELGLPLSLALGVAGGIVLGISGGFITLILGVTAFGLVLGFAFNLLSILFKGFSLIVSTVLAFGVVINIFIFIVLSFIYTPETGIITSLWFNIGLGFGLLRPEVWLIGLLVEFKIINTDFYFFARITLIPLSQLGKHLQDSLQRDWETGLHNGNQLLTYSLQFIIVVQAINSVITKISSDQIIWYISKIADISIFRNVLRFISASLYKGLILFFWRSLILFFRLIYIFFSSWFILGLSKYLSFSLQQKFESNIDARIDNLTLPKQFQIICRLNTPARATAAGFWYIYDKEPAKALEAFTVVRSALYGEEMYTLAQTLTIFHEAKEIKSIAALQIPTFPQETLLRPITWQALNSLKRVAEDVKFIDRGVSRAARSFALNRALGELTNILNTSATLPEAERDLIIDITKNWQEQLLQIAGEVGEVTITKPVTNPYIVGDPVLGHRFVGREDIMRELEEIWMTENQIQSVVIYGHRRMGKTSVLLNIVNRLGAGIQVAYVNMLKSADAPQGVGEVLMAMCDEISQAVKISPPNDDDLLKLPYRTFERFLKQVIANLQGGLIIAIDEFEKIEDLINSGKIPNDFMGYLRGLVQMSPKVGFAFAGLHTLEEMSADYFHPFFGSLINIRVGFQNRAATRQILANPDEDFLLDYTPEALNLIYDLTHGQPYLVQLFGFQLVRNYNDSVFEQGRKRDHIFTVEDVEAIINDSEFFQRGRYYFDGVWTQAADGVPGQQIIIRTLAPHPQGLGLDVLAESTGLNSKNLEDALNILQRHDVVEESQGNWRIIVEMFRRWVLRLSE